MKKVLKILLILSIFFATLVIFMTIDCHIMLKDFFNSIPEENGRGYGLGIIFVPILSTWKYTIFMIILAIIVKFNKKIDSITKKTIYILPILSFYGFLYATVPTIWLMELFNLYQAT